MSPAPCPAPGTPLPWVNLGKIQGFGKPRFEIRPMPKRSYSQQYSSGIEVVGDGAEANAAYIVHTANAYPDLVAEVSALRAALAGLLAVVDSYLGSDTINADIHDTTKAARAALAQGQGRAATPAPAQSATGTGVGA